jgi:hypothetical protein
MKITILETERLIMRGWRESDLEPLSAFYADEDSVRGFLAAQRRAT